MRRGQWWRRGGPANVDERIAVLEFEVSRLRASVQELGRILDNLAEGVVAVDRTGIVVHANHAAIELLAMDPARSIGHHMFAAVPNEQVCAALEPVMRGAAAWDEPLVREVAIVAGAGSGGAQGIATVLVTPLRERTPSGGVSSAGPDRGPEGAIAVVRDITDVRRAEAARADFVTNVSHELKTPVTAIRGIVETLLADDAAMPVDTRRRFLQKAARQSERLGTLVTDVIALSRIESDPHEQDADPVDLVLVASECAAACADAAEAAGVDVVVEAGSAVARVAGDEEALRQAVSNLVINAVTHSHPGTHVSVRVVQEDAWLVVEVADTGPGIAAEHQPRIFERFYRADPARSRERGGSGLGLSIVKHVALAHGGDVAVHSELGAGSCFRLRLPAVSAEA
jgi:two-component system phosphate regulon sensor histidine kinase PhoR